MRRGTHCQPLALVTPTRQLTVAAFCMQAGAGASSSSSPGQQQEAVQLQVESHPLETGGGFSYWWDSSTGSAVTPTRHESQQGGPSQACAYVSHRAVGM